MPKYMILFEYDGSGFNGWQRQQNTKNTVQELLESTVCQITGEPAKITAAGRTDTGVHAFNHVAHFFLVKSITSYVKFIYSLNSILPESVAVKNVKKVNDSFHARYSAKKREYIYQITTVPRAIGSKYYYRLHYKLDFALVNDFIEFIKNVKNFRSLCKNEQDKHDFACNIYELKYKINKSKGEIIFKITADRFLHSMVRAILGCIIEIGRKKIDFEVTKAKILSGEKLSTYFLPGKALFLNKVYY